MMTTKKMSRLSDAQQMQIVETIYVKDSSNAIVSLTQIVQISPDEVKTNTLNTNSPYKGLNKFEPDDKEYFFGRYQLVHKLNGIMNESPFFILIGATGSGKSSTIRAGLLPLLKEKRPHQCGGITLTPDQDPHESLYASLYEKFGQAEAQEIRKDPGNALITAAKIIKKRFDFCYIFIDQFEQLLTADESASKGRFIDSIVRACTYLIEQEDNSIKLFATMRDDFLGQLSKYPKLINITDKSRPIIPEMQSDELRMAIELPAARHGVVFEAGLVKRIIDEVQDQAGCLPLLQFTLKLLWDQQFATNGFGERTINTENYLKLEGVRGSLQRYIDNIFDKFSESEKEATQRIFLKLVGSRSLEESDVELKPVRRRASMLEFTSPEERAVIDILVKNSLLIANQQSDFAGATIEVCHESLISSWPTSREWIRKYRRTIALRNRLNEDARQWMSTRANGDLWSGARLEQALEMSRDSANAAAFGPLPTDTCVFLAESQAQRDQVQRERSRLQRRAIYALSVGLVTALGAAGAALLQAREADRQRQAASARRLASQVELARAQQPELTERNVSLALAAARRCQLARTDCVGIKELLLQELSYLPRPLGRMIHWDKVVAVAVSTDGDRVATGSTDGFARIWDPRAGRQLDQLLHPEAVFDVAISPDQKLLATACADGRAYLWELASGRRLASLAHEGAVRAVVFNEESTFLATASADQTARIWQLSDRSEVAKIKHGGMVSALAFSADTRYLATASWDGTARVWDIARGRERSRALHSDLVNAIAFSPNGEFIATASGEASALQGAKIHAQLTGGEGLKLYETWNGTHRPAEQADDSPEEAELPAIVREARLFRRADEMLRMRRSGLTQVVARGPSGNPLGERPKVSQIWSAATGQQIARMVHEDVVLDVKFSPDGRYVATGSEDKTARVWDATTGQEVSRMVHGAAVHYVTFSSDGNRVVTATGADRWADKANDNAAYVWDFRSDRKIFRMEHGASVNRVALSADGRLAVSVGDDNTANAWDISASYGFLGAHTLTLADMTFSPDGNYLATSSSDHNALLWNLSTGTEQAQIEHTGPIYNLNFSPDGRYLATASTDGLAKVIEVASGSQRFALKNDGRIDVSLFSPNSRYLATGVSEGTVRVWELSGGTQVSELRHDVMMWNEMDFSPDGELLITRGGQGQGTNAHIVFVWEVRTGRRLAALVHESSVGNWSFVRGGEYLAVASSDSAWLWEPRTGKLVAQMKHGGWVRHVAVAPDGRILAAGSRDKTARLFSLPTGKEIAQLKHADFVEDVVFSPDGKYLATVSGDHAAQLWQVADRRLVATMKHSSNLFPGWNQSTHRPMPRVRFSQDGQNLLTVTFDRSFHIWDLAGNEVARLNHAHNEKSLESMAASPDLSRLAAGIGSQIWLGSWQSEVLNQHVCARLSQAVSPREWERFFPKESYTPPCSGLPAHAEVYAHIKELVERGETNLATTQLAEVLKRERVGPIDAKAEVAWLAARKLVEQGEEAARSGKIEQARAMLHEAARLAPALNLDPDKSVRGIAAQAAIKEGIHLLRLEKLEEGGALLKKAQQLAPEFKIDVDLLLKRVRAQLLIQHARQIAFAGNEQGAIEKLNQAQALTPSIELKPVAYARHFRITGLVSEADELAAQGKIDSATEKLMRASSLDPSLKLAPRELAMQLAAAGLVAKIKPSFDSITTSLDLYKQAVSLDPKVRISSDTLNGLCWFGSLRGRVADALPICQQAVATKPNEASYLDSRGLARALSGDYPGAIADFRAFVRGNSLPGAKTRRLSWIESLRRGVSPFSAAELEYLRTEEM